MQNTALIEDHAVPDIHPAAATGAAAPGWLDHLKGAVAAVQRARTDRAMRAHLAELNASLLRDIGIADDEIHRIRAREVFTPRAWRT